MPQSWHSHQPWHTQRFPHCVAHLILITWVGAGREGSSIPGLFLGETEAPGVRRLPWLTLDGSPYLSHCPSRHGVSPCPSSAVISVSLFFPLNALLSFAGLRPLFVPVGSLYLSLSGPWQARADTFKERQLSLLVPLYRAL